MKPYKFQVGDKVLFWPKYSRGPFDSIGLIIGQYNGAYEISWGDGLSWGSGYLEENLILMQNGIDKLDEILFFKGACQGTKEIKR